MSASADHAGEPIRIVLCRPSHAGNIGAAARAMRVMGLDDLALVRPRTFPDPEATARAVSAEDVLARATVVDDLADAVGDCAHVVGFSARGRHAGPPPMDVAEAAREAVRRSSSMQVALVFGNERTGMTNDEINACHALATIPTGPTLSSLNLAAAVQVATYEVLRARGVSGEAAAPDERERGPRGLPATRDAVDSFLARLWGALEGRPRFHPEDPRVVKIQERLRRLIDRAGPTDAEMRAAHGVVSWLLPPEDAAP